MTTSNKKPFWQSKTIWVSFLIFVASILVDYKVVDLELSADAAWVGYAWDTDITNCSAGH